MRVALLMMPVCDADEEGIARKVYSYTKWSAVVSLVERRQQQQHLCCHDRAVV